MDVRRAPSSANKHSVIFLSLAFLMYLLNNFSSYLYLTVIPTPTCLSTLSNHLSTAKHVYKLTSSPADKAPFYCGNRALCSYIYRCKFSYSAISSSALGGGGGRDRHFLKRIPPLLVLMQLVIKHHTLASCQSKIVCYGATAGGGRGSHL